MSTESILSHPFVILIVGAIITGLLFPFLTNRWQRRQKDLELEFQLKLELMKKINESVTETIFTSLFASRSNTITNDEINRIYRKWEISSAQIESDIEAYFPNTEIRKEWHEYSENLKYFYTVFVNQPSKEGDPLEDRAELMTRIKNYLSTNNNIDWQGLNEGEGDLRRRYNSFAKLGIEVINKKSLIIRKILESHMRSIERDSLIQALNLRMRRCSKP